MDEELSRIEAADELQLASVRRDSALLNPVTIWVVRVGDDVYVRSVLRARLELTLRLEPPN